MKQPFQYDITLQNKADHKTNKTNYNTVYITGLFLHLEASETYYILTFFFDSISS